jgi:hypothetical protein
MNIYNVSILYQKYFHSLVGEGSFKESIDPWQLASILSAIKNDKNPHSQHLLALFDQRTEVGRSIKK